MTILRPALFLSALALAAGLAASPVGAGDGAPILVDTRGESVLKGVVTDATNSVVPKAEVRVYRWIDLFGRPLGTPPDGEPPFARRTAVSADDGTFRIEALAAEEHVVRVLAPGYGLGVFRGVVPSPKGDLDYALVLPRGLTAEGRVENRAGKGVGNAIVSARVAFVGRATDWAEFHAGRVYARTGPDGKFRLEGIPEAAAGAEGPGLDVDAQAPDRSATVRRWCRWNGTDALKPLVLGGASAIAGTVRDESGAPLAGARVLATASGDHVENALEEWPEAEATTDAKGNYRLGVPSVSRVTAFFVSLPRFGAMSRILPSPLADPKPDGAATQDFVLHRGRTLSLSLVGPGDAPMSGALALVEDAGTLYDAEGPTGADGKASFPGLQWQSDPVSTAIWRWSLLLETPGFFPEKADTLKIAVDETLGTERAHTIRMVRTVAVAGMVRDPDGNPAPNALVAAERMDGGFAVMPFQPWEVVARTDRNGRFLLANLGPLTHRLTATSPSHPGTIARGTVRLTPASPPVTEHPLRLVAAPAPGGK